MARTIYQTTKEGSTATGSVYKKSWAEQGSLFIAETPVAKLYLILLMIIYGVIVYSKGKTGVENDDVSLLVFFSIFVIGSVISVEVLTILKRKLTDEFKNSISIPESVKRFFSQYFVPIFFVLGLFGFLFFLCYYSGKLIAEILWIISHIVR